MSYDVEINGQGFMVVPGTYTRTQDGIGESRIGRVRLFDFFGGGQRAAQLERDRFWHGAGAWPAFDSQGVVPGPKRSNFIESLSGSNSFNPHARTWGAIFDGTAYLAQEDRIYEVTVSSGIYGGLSHVQTTTATITDAVVARGEWYFAHGTAATVSKYTFDDGSYTVDTLGSATSRKTDVIGTHLGYIAFQTVDHWQQDRVSLQEISTTARDQRFVNGKVRAFVQHRGDCWFISDRGLYRFTMGGVDEANHTADYSAEASIEPLGYDDDLEWLVSHLGDLWVWMGKEVHRFNTADRIFEPMGLRGRATHGATSVGRYLVVNIEHERDGHRQLWAWDGRGWWLLDEETDSSTAFGWPVTLWGVAENADLFAGRSATDNLTAIWQVFSRDGAPGYADAMTLTSSLLDGGERDLEKVWRKIGAVFAWPDERTGTGDVDVTLEYSTDAGETWTELATGTIGPSDASVEIAGEVSGAVRSRFLQIRVSMENVGDWSPVLLGMWAEHETLDLEVRRRRWRFKIEASDTALDRDGAPVGDARAISDALWDAWGERVVTFRDIDYAHDSTEHTVRVASLFRNGVQATGRGDPGHG